MTGSVGSHTLIVAVYLAAGVIVALGLRGLLTRLQRKAEQTRWRGGGIVVAFLRLVAPWCLGVGCAWAGVLNLRLVTAHPPAPDQPPLPVHAPGAARRCPARPSGAGRRPMRAALDRRPSS